MHSYIISYHICDVTDKMKIFSVISTAYCFLLAVNGTSISAKGSEGGTVSFRSFHKLAQNSHKYFCRYPCTSEEHILAKVTPSGSTVSDRVTLSDHGDGSFTVILSDLRRSDSGTYWCGVDRFFMDTFTPVYLQVTEGLSYKATTSIETTAITEVAGTFGYKIIINSTEETFQADCSTNCSQGRKKEETTTTRTLQQEKEKHSREGSATCLSPWRCTPAPLGLVPNDTTVQTARLSWDYLSSTTLPTVPTSEGSDKEPATSLTDTTVVIIVSVSLALLVCAIIPLIFYGHWRSSGEEQSLSTAGGNKSGVEYSDEHTAVPLVQTAVALQSDPDPEAPDEALYASVYQALDPQSLD